MANDNNKGPLGGELIPPAPRQLVPAPFHLLVEIPDTALAASGRSLFDEDRVGGSIMTGKLLQAGEISHNDPEQGRVGDEVLFTKTRGGVLREGDKNLAFIHLDDVVGYRQECVIEKIKAPTSPAEVDQMAANEAAKANMKPAADNTPPVFAPAKDGPPSAPGSWPGLDSGNP